MALTERPHPAPAETTVREADPAAPAADAGPPVVRPAPGSDRGLPRRRAADLSLRVRLRRWLRIGRKPTERRLLANLTETTENMERRIADLGLPDGQRPSWARSARRLLEEASQALDRGDLETGFVCLSAAHRAEILALSPAELKAAAAALHQEASSEKFGGWRGKAIVGLLQDLVGEKPGCSQDPADHRAWLIEARGIRDEKLQNEYRKIERLQQQLLMLGLALALSVGGIIVLTAVVDLPGTTRFDFSPAVLGLVAMFGALGGCLTAILSVIRGGTSYSIPQQLIQGSVVLIRPFFGAAAALAVYAFVGSGLITVASSSTAATMAMSFVAGFSEQLITSSVARVAPKSGDPSIR
jgi:hypothetical protein